MFLFNKTEEPSVYPPCTSGEPTEDTTSEHLQYVLSTVRDYAPGSFITLYSIPKSVSYGKFVVGLRNEGLSLVHSAHTGNYYVYRPLCIIDDDIVTDCVRFVTICRLLCKNAGPASDVCYEYTSQKKLGDIPLIEFYARLRDHNVTAMGVRIEETYAVISLLR